MVLIILLLLFHTGHGLIILLLLFHTGHGVDYPTTTVPLLDIDVDYPTTTVPHWTWC
ncbi:hypothetical protein DPMN_130818 [Dreissena polymorpha]|uniref:Uncharacterized protein n=1 Tax=Dreissena polymorpha TaxID=45954 RepID=A0A9D4H3I7_DREPO|nr:hypothetical protein DPMN_130818 [Dreissena polymorpha]